VAPEWIEKIRAESERYFPDPRLRQLALAFLEHLAHCLTQVEEKYQADLADLTQIFRGTCRSQEEIDQLSDRIKREYLGRVISLKDTAWEDYILAAVITKTLLPEAVWQEKVAPVAERNNIPDRIPRLFSPD
jgi:hypothetical protein